MFFCDSRPSQNQKTLKTYCFFNFWGVPDTKKLYFLRQIGVFDRRSCGEGSPRCNSHKDRGRRSQKTNCFLRKLKCQMQQSQGSRLSMSKNQRKNKKHWLPEGAASSKTPICLWKYWILPSRERKNAKKHNGFYSFWRVVALKTQKTYCVFNILPLWAPKSRKTY